MAGTNEIDTPSSGQKLNGGPRIPSKRTSRCHSSYDKIDLEALRQICSRTVDKHEYELCDEISNNIPCYDLTQHDPADTQLVNSLQDEWYDILRSGPGVLVLRNFIQNKMLVDEVTELYDTIIAKEAAHAQGDHFAAGGKNSRIWNSFEKHAEHDSFSFLRYYSNPWLCHMSEAWLGPAYQVTAQVNLVKPGGQAQMPHRDYHLGFQVEEQAAKWPKSMHHASQFLTLQGAVAHTDMTLNSGPTRFLPFSQTLDQGYLAYRDRGVKQYFQQNWVSAPLMRGDAVFFNPAIFHAAGENISDTNRGANLLQISSAFGKPMETIDNLKIVDAVWDELRHKAYREGAESLRVVCCAKAISLGYPFPTNLDSRKPRSDGMAPESETDMVLQGLREDWGRGKIVRVLEEIRDASRA